MRALFRGERTGSAVQVFTLVAVAIIAGVCFFLIWSARHTAQVANKAVVTVGQRYAQSQAQVYRLCIQREGIEHHLREVEATDVSLQAAQIAIESKNPFIDDKVRTERIRAFTEKWRADEAYLKTPIEDGCEKLKP